MICKNCQKENRQIAKFCRWCGKPLVSQNVLDRMIGLDEVKQQLKMVVDTYTYLHSRKDMMNVRLSVNTIIIGETGTGKTALAEVLRDYFYQYKIIDKPKLTMATNAYFPPYEYYEGDNIIGIDAEVAKAIADKLGMELEIVDIEFDSIITGVQTGKYDMGMAGMTVTDERKESVDFSVQDFTDDAAPLLEFMIRRVGETRDVNAKLEEKARRGYASLALMLVTEVEARHPPVCLIFLFHRRVDHHCGYSVGQFLTA